MYEAVEKDQSGVGQACTRLNIETQRLVEVTDSLVRRLELVCRPTDEKMPREGLTPVKASVAPLAGQIGSATEMIALNVVTLLELLHRIDLPS